MNDDLISRYALRKSVTDELERLYCVLYKHNEYFQATKKAFNTVLDFIDRAPTVEFPEQITMKFDCETEEDKQKLLSLITNRPQDNLAEKLKDRIEESVCGYCQMNKHCELCEISRVFLIIDLTNEETKGGTT